MVFRTHGVVHVSMFYFCWFGPCVIPVAREMVVCCRSYYFPTGNSQNICRTCWPHNRETLHQHLDQRPWSIFHVWVFPYDASLTEHTVLLIDAWIWRRPPGFPLTRRATSSSISTEVWFCSPFQCFQVLLHSEYTPAFPVVEILGISSPVKDPAISRTGAYSALFLRPPAMC